MEENPDVIADNDHFILKFSSALPEYNSVFGAPPQAVSQCFTDQYKQSDR